MNAQIVSFPSSASSISTAVKEILASNSVGVGKTTDIAETFTFTDENTLSIQNLGEFKLSDEIQKAKLIHYLSSEGKKTSMEALKKTLEAMEKGFLGTAHQNNAGKEAKKPVVATGNIITSDDYLSNAVKLNLTKDDLSDEILSLDTKVIEFEELKISDAMTKADILKALQSLYDITKQYQDLFITETNRGTYHNMLAKEKELQEKFEALTAIGFKNVLPVGDSLVAKLDTTDAKALQQLPELGYMLVNTDFDAVNLVINVYFKELPRKEETENK